MGHNRKAPEIRAFHRGQALEEERVRGQPERASSESQRDGLAQALLTSALNSFPQVAAENHCLRFAFHDVETHTPFLYAFGLILVLVHASGMDPACKILCPSLMGISLRPADPNT